jgi:hypothetical protein
MSAKKQLRQQEIEGVLKSDGPTRYAHFVSQVSDWALVWGLRSRDGWVMISNSTGKPMFPVWPHEEYANLLAVGEWANAAPVSVEVHEWVDKWLPGLHEDDTKVAVFPTPAGKGVVVEALHLQRDIEAELERLE